MAPPASGCSARPAPSVHRGAAALPAASKTPYDEALPAVVRGSTVAGALRSVAPVMNGSMTRDRARIAAEAAGACSAQLS